MSKRNDRHEADRLARRAAYLQSRQPLQSVETPIQTEPLTIETELETSIAAEPQPTQISQVQLTANQTNAQLSTGPSTTAGRAKSAQNSLKHGLTSKVALLATEDATIYQNQHDAHLNQFKPATIEEHRLVQSLTDSIWRINRAQQLESAILLKGYLEFANKFEDQPASERRLLIQAETYLKYEKSIRNLNVQEARLRRNMEKDRAELMRLQATRKRDELIAAEAEAKSSQLATKAAAANGFVFSNRTKASEVRSEIPASSHLKGNPTTMAA